MEHIEHSSIQDLPKLIPSSEEQENLYSSSDSDTSSSDIEVIEISDEIVTSFSINPSNLSTNFIDPSRMTSTSEEINIVNEDLEVPEISDSSTIEETLHETAGESPARSEYLRNFDEFLRSFNGEKDTRNPESQRPQPVDAIMPLSLFDILSMLIRSLQPLQERLPRLNPLDAVLFVMFLLPIIYIHTGFRFDTALKNPESQMKIMFDELQYNTVLKDQLLLELKTENLFLAFENQIRQLRNHNSKFNKMFYDNVNILDEKIDFQINEKEESKDLASFQKGVNLLKERIYSLKAENKELQKQLHQMRSISMHRGIDETEKYKAKEQKETDFEDEMPLDICLKKWNELVALLGKESGSSLESEKIHPETKKSSINCWCWKDLFEEFKGKLDDLKESINSKISGSSQEHTVTIPVEKHTVTIPVEKHTVTIPVEEHTVTIPVEQQNNQQFVPPFEDIHQWNFYDYLSFFINILKQRVLKVLSTLKSAVTYFINPI